MISVISHVRTPDWLSLRLLPPQPAAEALRGILTAWEGAEDKIFSIRGMAMLLIEERELWKYDEDPEVGQPFASFDRWLKVTLPKSWGYCRDALRTIKELREMPFDDLVAMKRANLEQLKRISPQVRRLPEVVTAAKTLPEKAFVAKMNQDYNQHLEANQPVTMAPPSVSTIIDQAIEMAIALEGCKSRGEAEEAIHAYFVTGCQGQYEKYLKEQIA